MCFVAPFGSGPGVITLVGCKFWLEFSEVVETDIAFALGAFDLASFALSGSFAMASFAMGAFAMASFAMGAFALASFSLLVGETNLDIDLGLRLLKGITSNFGCFKDPFCDILLFYSSKI